MKVRAVRHSRREASKTTKSAAGRRRCASCPKPHNRRCMEKGNWLCRNRRRPTPPRSAHNAYAGSRTAVGSSANDVRNSTSNVALPCCWSRAWNRTRNIARSPELPRLPKAPMCVASEPFGLVSIYSTADSRSPHNERSPILWNIFRTIQTNTKRASVFVMQKQIKWESFITPII